MRLYFCEKDTHWAAMKIILMTMFSLSTTVSGWLYNDDSREALFEGEKCTTRAGDAGICTRIHACEMFVIGLKRKSIEYESLIRCSFAGLTEVVCCPTEPSTPPPTTPTVQGFPTRHDDERPSVAACRRYRELNPALLVPQILDGAPVAPGTYPHMGGLIYPVGGGDNIDIYCGASLISERYALTAAHCVNDPLALPTMLRLGVVSWNSTDDGIMPVDVEIENVTIHTLYHYPSRYHDIALIRLKKDVEITSFVSPGCLYSDINDIDSVIKLIVVGWGVTNVTTRARSTVLLETNVTTSPLKDCNATHLKYGVSRENIYGLSSGQYCAYDPHLLKDSCLADSGGPLMWVKNHAASIVGIVSFGNLCATEVPSVYVRVAYYLDWIESIVWPS